MILETLQIDGFGHFQAYTLDKLKPGFNLITGQNEAGKSTLLNFIRFTLMGYPSRTSERCEPIHGGKHGGRILLSFHNGDSAVLERFAGSKGGTISLRINDTVTDPRAWENLINHANPILYRNIYGISLHELSDALTIKEAGIADKILSIGIGLGSVSVKEVTQALQDTIDSIYKTNGRTQQLPALLKRVDDRKGELQKARLNLPRYEQLGFDIEKLKDSLKDINSRMQELKKKKWWLEVCEKGYPIGVEILQLNRQLDSLPVKMDCPENSRTFFDQLVSRRKIIKDAIRLVYQNAANDGIDQLQEQLRFLKPDAAILAQKFLISELREDLSLFESELSIYRDTSLEIEQGIDKIKQSLTDLSTPWSLEILEIITGIEDKKQRIAVFQKESEELTQNILRCETRMQERPSPSWWSRLQPIQLIAISCMIMALPLLYYAWTFSAALFVLSLILFVFRRYFERPVQDPLQIQLDALIVQKQELDNRYRTFLREDLLLSEDLTIQTVQLILSNIEPLRAELKRYKSLQERNQTVRLNFLQSYREKLQTLVSDFKDDEQARMHVQAVSEALEKEQEAHRKMEHLKEKLLVKEAEADQLLDELKGIQTEIKDLLALCQVNTEVEFEHKVEMEALARRLRTSRSDKWDTLELMIGQGRVDAFFDEIKSIDLLTIQLDITNLDSTIRELDQVSNEQHELLGKYKNEQELLVDKATLSSVGTQLETEKQNLKQAWMKWLSGKLAMDVFNQVKLQYEKEQQPAVIQKAGDYFRLVTNGRYCRIQLSMEDQSVWVIDPMERAKSIDQLSRGTKEQLLICLRLALIGEYEKNSEPLPLVLDDILVNSDPERIQAMARLLEQFAEGRQVILFTCHSYLSDYFSEKVNRLYC
jgi:uncharacterized protein YhaN